jgi:hypothetical protein
MDSTAECEWQQRSRDGDDDDKDGEYSNAIVNRHKSRPYELISCSLSVQDEAISALTGSGPIARTHLA